VLLGLAGAALGSFGLLDGGSPQVAGVPVLGWPLLLAGAAAAAVGFRLGGRRVGRSRYRPDPWALPEWLVSVAGLGTAAAFLVTAVTDPAALAAPLSPPGWPGLSPLPLLGVALALVPAWAAPPPRATADPAAAAPTASERLAA
jgi:energy-coupling factor transport system permease protein